MRVYACATVLDGNVAVWASRFLEALVAVVYGRRPIEVVAFSTDHNELRVNDVGYSGTKGPQAVVPRGSIFWSADAQSALVAWVPSESESLPRWGALSGIKRL